MSFNSSKLTRLVKYPRLHQHRHSSQLSAAHILNGNNLKRCIECIRKTAPIQMLSGKTEVQAAVLVPICITGAGEVSLLYTKRSGTLSRHVRQVSFPGGIKDSADASYEDCALRETEEEIGLERSRVKIIGQGTLLRPPGAAAIMPVFGIVENLSINKLKLNCDEVDEAFTLPISKLTLQESRRHTQFRAGYSSPVFLVDNYKVWGLTGGITHIFLSCLLPDNYNRRIPHVKKYRKV